MIRLRLVRREDKMIGTFKIELNNSGYFNIIYYFYERF